MYTLELPTFTKEETENLITIYHSLCPDDMVREDDDRRESIAWEVYSVGVSTTVDKALSVIAWWDQSDEWNRHFVKEVRKRISKMNFSSV